MADLSPAPSPSASPAPGEPAAAQPASAQPTSAQPAAFSPDSASASASEGTRLHGLDAVTGSKPRPEPLDPPMVPFALAGTAIFILAGAILLIAGAPDSWLWTCLAGVICGIPGLLTMLRHDANRRRRRALSHPEFTINDPA